MRKMVFLLLVFYLASCNNKLDNTVYEGRVGSSCAKTTTGGLMIYDSCRLNFKKDSVRIEYYQIDTDNPNEIRENRIESHKYTFNGNVVEINDFQYGKLFHKKDLLFALHRSENTDTLKFRKK